MNPVDSPSAGGPSGVHLYLWSLLVSLLLGGGDGVLFNLIGVVVLLYLTIGYFIFVSETFRTGLDSSPSFKIGAVVPC